MLRILTYYRLPKSTLIPEISARLSQVFKSGDSWAVDIDPPVDIDELVRLRYSPSPKQALPNQAHYEELFSTSFEKVRVRLGEKEPMRLMGEDCMCSGTLFFLPATLRVNRCFRPHSKHGYASKQVDNCLLIAL